MQGAEYATDRRRGKHVQVGKNTPAPGETDRLTAVPATRLRRSLPALALAVGAAAAAPQPAQSQRGSQAFSGGTELVVVDFVALDKADRPARGLSARDFVVKEDGKEQPIVKFEAFDVDRPGTAASTTTPAAAPAPAAPITRAPDASTVILVNDGQLSQAQAARLRPALKALLGRVGQSSGTLMLVSPQSAVSVAATLPAGAGDLAAVVDRIQGFHVEEHSNFPLSDAEALAIARGEIPPLTRVALRLMTLNPELTREQAATIAHERARDVAFQAQRRRDVVYDAALLCLDWLAARPGRHGLIIVSRGFPADPDDGKYYDVVSRSLRANAPIYFLDARGLQVMGAYQGAEYGFALSRDADEEPFAFAHEAEGAANLADDSGGFSIANSNDMEKGLGRLLEATSTYYVLAYQAPAHTKAGFHKIKVEVRTKGLHIRARRGYFASPAPR